MKPSTLPLVTVAEEFEAALELVVKLEGEEREEVMLEWLEELMEEEVKSPLEV